jgi:hypothetical protein
MRRSNVGCFLRVAALSAAALLAGGSGVSAAPATKPAFRPIVNLPTFMEHVLSPAADAVWRANGTMADSRGEHDLTPTTEPQWEAVVSAAATLAEATNALMIPQRQVDGAWSALAARLARAAESAYQAAEAHSPDGLARAGQRIDAACTGCHKHYGLE